MSSQNTLTKALNSFRYLEVILAMWVYFSAFSGVSKRWFQFCAVLVLCNFIRTMKRLQMEWMEHSSHLGLYLFTSMVLVLSLPPKNFCRLTRTPAIRRGESWWLIMKSKRMMNPTTETVVQNSSRTRDRMRCTILDSSPMSITFRHLSITVKYQPICCTLCLCEITYHRLVTGWK